MGLIDLNVRLTWNEIVSRYPDQWVGLEDLDWKNESNVSSAVVKYTDSRATEDVFDPLLKAQSYGVYSS